MILHPPTTSTRQLSWQPAEKMYVGEVSDTNGFGRVYDDACDVGMTLLNPTTGVEVVVVVDYEERDHDGDVVFWQLKPAAPAARPFTVTLWND